MSPCDCKVKLGSSEAGAVMAILTYTHVVDVMESHLTCIDAFGI